MTPTQIALRASVTQPFAWSPLSSNISEALPSRPTVISEPASDEAPPTPAVTDEARLEPTSISLLTGERRRRQLLHHADLQILALALVADAPISMVSASAVRTLLRRLVATGQPAPQLTRNPSGALEVNWLVDGTLVALVVEPGGEWMLWAERPTGEEFINVEGLPGEVPALSTVLDLQHLLQSMGRSARFWPTI